MSAHLWNTIKNEKWCVAVSGMQWSRSLWPATEYYNFIGGSGGSGQGYGAPAAVGAALANRDKGIVTVAIEGDGDLMYAPGSLWTAAHHKIPLLMIVHNNRAYHREVMHLQRMAGLHNRRMDTAAIGTTIENPNIDLRQARAIHGRARRRTDHESRCHRSGAIPRSRRRKARRAGAGRCSFPGTLRGGTGMHKLVSAALLVLAASAAFAQDPPPPGSGERGQQAFMKYMCYTCHGTVGQGADRGTGPKMAPGMLPYAAFALQVRTPRLDMPPYRQQFLSDQELADIYAYLSLTKPSPAAKEIPLLDF